LGIVLKNENKADNNTENCLFGAILLAISNEKGTAIKTPVIEDIIAICIVSISFPNTSFLYDIFGLSILSKRFNILGIPLNNLMRLKLTLYPRNIKITAVPNIHKYLYAFFLKIYCFKEFIP